MEKKDYLDTLACFERCLELGEPPREYLVMKGVGIFKALLTKYYV